jgi:hypothetical protein
MSAAAFAARTPAQATYWNGCATLLGEVADLSAKVLSNDEVTEQVVHGLLANSAARSASEVLTWLLQQPELLAAALKHSKTSAQAPLNNEEAVTVQLACQPG